MRVLILTNKLPYPPRDGGSIATLNMITGLRDAGNQVTCMALNTNKHNFPIEKIPENLSASVNFIGIECNSSLRPLRMLTNLLFSKIPYIAVRFNNSEFRRRLSQMLEKEEFDVVQLEGPYPGHYLDTVRTGSGALISFRAHNVEHLIWRRKADNEKNLLKRWYLSNMATRLDRFEMGIVRQCDCLVAISPIDEDYFKEKGAGIQTITIPTGLTMGSYPFTELPPSPTLFFIGALDWLPNQEGLKWFLDNVLCSLLEERPGLVFHVAGRNAPPAVEKLLTRDQVVYHGEVENAREFMQAYQIMVAPLLTGSGIRIKILEAMALGRPVVTTGIGIAGIPAGNGQEVMTAETPEEFKNQLFKLFANNEKTMQIVAMGRKLIKENFDTFELSTRLSRFFKEQA